VQENTFDSVENFWLSGLIKNFWSWTWIYGSGMNLLCPGSLFEIKMESE
jgi:hypothetical protein